MATNSQEYKIGDFLKRIKRLIDLIDDKEYKLVTIKLHHNGVTLRETKKGSEIKSKMYEVKAGDFILSGIDARNGAFGIVPEELDGAIVTNDFWYFDIDEKIIDKHFFLELTATEWFDEICKKGSDGTTQRIRLQKDKFFNQTINLPDRSEQDKLLTVFKSRKKLTEKLSARITNHLELIPLLRQQILQDAITGKLSEKWRKQNPNIESAEVLLEKIKTEKEKLVREGKIKKQKTLPPITENEIPFALPEGWVWCRLGEIIELISGQDLQINQYNDVKQGIPYITGASHFNNGQLTITRWTDKPKSISFIGDLLITCKGTIGEMAFNSYGNMHIARQIMALRNLYSLNLKFISNFLTTKIDDLKYNAKSLIPGISRSEILNMYFPLPPLAEQKYIVERIESLFANLNRIGKLNTENQEDVKMLNQVILKEMFED